MEELINEKISYRLRRIGAPATMKDVADVFAYVNSYPVNSSLFLPINM